MKNLLLEICRECGYKDPPNKSGITIELLIEGSLSGSIIKYLQDRLKCSKDPITRATRNAFPDKPIKHDSLVKFLLAKRSLRKCACCDTVKSIEDFYLNKDKGDGVSTSCKECNKAARRASYAKDPQKEIQLNSVRKRSRDTLQTPNWADLDKITEFYRNRPEGMHVDHIVPLNGEYVSGLHVLENLQYLSAFDNLSKGNR